MYVSFIKLQFICLLLLSSTATAEIFKWVDKHGQSHFSDQAPANKQVESVELGEITTYKSASVVSNNDVVIDVEDAASETKKQSGRKKVVMYSATWCGVCTKAKKYFRKNKIPFKSYDIDSSKKGKRDFKKLKARGVPVILVGKKRLNGFNVSKFEAIYRL